MERAEEHSNAFKRMAAFHNPEFHKLKSLSMLISKCFDHYFQFMLRFYIQG